MDSSGILPDTFIDQIKESKNTKKISTKPVKGLKIIHNPIIF